MNKSDIFPHVYMILNIIFGVLIISCTFNDIKL